MLLSQNSNTPISFWLSRPLKELDTWISVNNEIVKEREKETKK